MRSNFNEKLIAYLALVSGLSISAVAVYYSVVGLVAIFAAAAIPIMIMGGTLEVSKLVATVWLKQNWNTSPFLIKLYLFIAIITLMVITSIGIFGFLSKAHLDQSMPSGDVTDKIAIFDEKIKTQKENIEAYRKALKQMDESVDQTMSRSTDETGATRAANLRRAQQRERTQLQGDIAKAQKDIAALNEERAPIAKELRKVEAEVGPIKYIAAFVYGVTDPTILEKAVTWVIIILIVVFDPLAVILLLASQYSFQRFREAQIALTEIPTLVDVVEPTIDIPDAISTNTTELIVETPSVSNNPTPAVVKLDPGAIKTKVFPREDNPETYVQNEEQQVSNLWTATTSKPISQEEYLQQSQIKQQEYITDAVEKIKSGELKINDIRVDLHSEIKKSLHQSREEKITQMINDIKNNKLTLEDIPLEFRHEIFENYWKKNS